MKRFVLPIFVAIAAVVVIVSTPYGPAAKPVEAAAHTQTFTATGAPINFVVPGSGGLTVLIIEANGAAGGASACGTLGGPGGRASGWVAFTPGSTLQLNVGGQATGTTGGLNGGGNGGLSTGAFANPARNGGGGGGASDVRTTPYALGDRLVVGAGGGGGGGCGSSATGGTGGAAEANGTNGNGGTPGIQGGSATFGGGSPGGAGGGTGTAGTAGTNAIGGTGGSSSAATTQGGGGGGGGGGIGSGGAGGGGDSGANGSGGGGGGGGFNRVIAGSTNVAITTNPVAAGSITITYYDPLIVSKSFTPGTIQSGGTSTLTLTLNNPNAIGVSLIFLTDNFTATGITITGAPTGAPLCAGTITAPIGGSQITYSGGTLAAGDTCTISVTVTHTTPGTYVNTTGAANAVPTAPNSAPASATLVVGAVLAVPTPTATATAVPTATPTQTPVVIPLLPPPPPVIPQVFQHVPQGIFNGTRNNTPTPVVRVAVAPIFDPGVSAMPVLRPPSTGDAGLMTERGSSFVPLIVLAGVLSVSAGAAWRLRAR